MSYSAQTGYRFCCGFVEIGEFNEGYTTKETPKELIDMLTRDYQSGQLFHIWFVKEAMCEAEDSATGEYEDTYGWNEVREYIQTLPGVMHLGEHVNPNSDNMIDGYMWKKQ